MTLHSIQGAVPPRPVRPAPCSLVAQNLPANDKPEAECSRFWLSQVALS